jgi:hypothetical protein
VAGERALGGACVATAPEWQRADRLSALNRPRSPGPLTGAQETGYRGLSGRIGAPPPKQRPTAASQRPRTVFIRKPLNHIGLLGGGLRPVCGRKPKCVCLPEIS